jgi:glycerophosphoryl diester phosphodiesterase
MNVVGHRGASGSQPENTPSAFLAADSMGADGVELDLRLAPDGSGGHRLVVFHDPLPDSREATDALVGFGDVLDACGERMLVNVEIKNSADDGGHDPTMAVVGPAIAAMRERGPAWAHRWLISSFDLDTIDRCRRVAPEIPTAFLVLDATDAAITVAVERGHVAIHPWVQTLNEAQVTASHDAGLLVNVWTCNDPEHLAELQERQHLLTGLERIPVCVAYEVDGQRFDEIPVSQSDFHHATPVYEELPGWSEDITGARTFEDLPKNAQDYVLAVEAMSGARISAIGVGPGRDAIIQRHDLLG